jgi:hypothetical protein
VKYEVEEPQRQAGTASVLTMSSAQSWPQAHVPTCDDILVKNDQIKEWNVLRDRMQKKTANLDGQERQMTTQNLLRATALICVSECSY